MLPSPGSFTFLSTATFYGVNLFSSLFVFVLSLAFPFQFLLDILGFETFNWSLHRRIQGFGLCERCRPLASSMYYSTGNFPLLEFVLLLA